MSQDNRIDASPTKEFFISILVRDIKLIDAVKDLVDNCVDGARKLRGSGTFEGLTISIEVSPTHFLIVDNCGGIPVDVAKHYAFRFGRPDDAPPSDGSIGRFGVGMKRALFKIGTAFKVKSKATDSHFALDVDVNKWKALKDDKGRDLWEFEFTESVEGESNPESATGTILEVTALHPNIADEFASDSFRTRLINGLQEAHEQTIEKGLVIEVNDVTLQYRLATLLASSQLKPIRIEKTFPPVPGGEITAPVKMALYAGVGESDIGDAGWYIICNGRQILKADKTPLTGWDTVWESTNTTTPKAHGQFSRFRGYVHFDSDDARALPWNTAKSGVDAESGIFQWARVEMGAALRQVIDFLNRVDAELDGESVHFKSLLEDAKSTKLAAIAPSTTFAYADTTVEEKPKVMRVSFVRAIEDVAFAKSHFKVGSAKDAGNAALEYFLQRERE